MRVRAQDAGRHDLVQESLDRGRRHEGLAEAIEAVLAVDPHPDDVGELEQPDRLELGDLHADAPVRVREFDSRLLDDLVHGALGRVGVARPDRVQHAAHAWRGPAPSG